jgi:FKBP-type peptidyl-prolyl cis-trans isomerase
LSEAIMLLTSISFLLLLVACGPKTTPAAFVSPNSAPGLEQGDAIPAPADVAAPPRKAQHTDSGLATLVLRPGSGGARPGPFDNVLVNYTGWTTDGAMFDSSSLRGQPANFPLTGVIEGFAEGLRSMTVGEQRRLWIPEELAYQGKPQRPAGMLVFDVELLEIIAAPAVPEHLDPPHPDAWTSPTGLVSMVLRPGIGARHPSATSIVKVHYSGWTTDGVMFDSSVMRDRPATFPLNRVIAGWTEGLQQMVIGELRRFWIPPELAYLGKPGRPQGVLVFDVELLDFED